MTAAAAALEDDEEVRFATLPIFHCAVLSPRGRDGRTGRPRGRGRRANGMTMPALATRASSFDTSLPELWAQVRIRCET